MPTSISSHPALETRNLVPFKMTSYTSENNFSHISPEDEQAFTSCRPGYSPKNEFPKAVPNDDVAAWVAFMKEKGVTRVISLLGDDEVEWYKEPMEQLLEKNGMDPTKYSRTSVFSPNARDVILGAMKAADENGEKFVVHCSQGQGRAGMGSALWLVHKYGLSPEEAAEVVKKTGGIRGGNQGM
eukprot:comp12236_c0_seq1/m.7028 comp12236_c0_seq1/g.7028  ORF comp12236_c0_seq1/g.7028 comp12236_c0_seq1/m.7028 type:complete len:184 (-) comp12236_c0_seq1:502-1053(-)